jgi:hypothetical protein
MGGAGSARSRRSRKVRAVPRKGRILLAALLGCVCLALATVALAAQTLTIHASFSPDRLGAPTNLSATGSFTTGTGAIPSPITKFTIYGPAGSRIDVHGAGVCLPTKLQELGPSVCPSNSRAGFGGGVGVFELSSKIVHEQFTVDMFLGPRQNGRLTLLMYVRAFSPASIEFVLTATEVHAHRPYGIGFTANVPVIPTIPGASNASVESAFVTFGATNVAYYETVHGKRTLLHVKGLIAPDSCPRGGFPIEGSFDFADGSTTSGRAAIPCPDGS